MADNRYEVIQELGKGANGIVNAEFDTHNKVGVARKYLSNPALSTADLKREFRQLANASHPNLVQLYELEADGEEISFTMELVEGVNIVDYSASHPEQIRSLFEQTVSACAYLHEHRIVHRDIKPSNILVQNGRVALLDFGLATLAGKSGEGAFTGTPRYSAPEQLLGQPATPKSDLFAVGILFAEIFLGEPYEWVAGWKTEHLPTNAVDDLLVLSCVNSLLAMNPEARPSAKQLVSDLGLNTELPERPPFVGRLDEMQVVTGQPDIYAIVGESGIGKSRFLEEASQNLTEKGQTVLFSRCRNWENIGFQAIDSIVDQLSPDVVLPSLSEIEVVALTQAFSMFSSQTERKTLDAKLKREAISSGLRKCIVEMNSNNTLVLVIDDFQWVDKDSFAVLEYLINADVFSDIRLLLGCRSEDLHALDELGASVKRVELRGLNLTEASSLLGTVLPTELVGALNAQCAGSPYFLLEAHKLSNLDLSAVEQDRKTILRSKFDKLSAELRLVIDLICISHGPIDKTLVQMNLETGSSHYDLLYLEKGAWVRPVRIGEKILYEPFHSRLKEFVVSDLGDQITPLHQRLASSIAVGDPENFEALSFHYEGAEEFDTAGTYAMKAGVVAEGKLAFDSADSFYTKAAELKEFGLEQGGELKLRHAQVKHNLGDCRDAAVLASSVARSSYLPKNEQILLIANSWFSAGYLENGLQQLSKLVTQRKLAEPGRNWLWLKLGIQVLKLRLDALKPSNRVSDEDRAWMSEVYWSLGKLNMMSTKHGTYFQLLALESFLKQGDERKIALGLAVFSNVLNHLGFSKDYANRCMEKAEQIGLSYEDELILATCDLWKAHIELNNENWRSASCLAIVAISKMESMNKGLSWECTTAKNFYLMSLERLGDIETLLSENNSFIQQAVARGDHYALTIFGLFEAFWSIPTNSLQATLQDLENISDRWSTAGYTIQDFYLVRVKIYALLYHGKAEAAKGTLQQAWPMLVGSDVLDVASSEIDALVMYGLVLLHLYRNGSSIEDLKLSLKDIYLRLKKAKLPEGETYAAFLEGMFQIHKNQRETAIDLLELATVKFRQNESYLMADSCDFALGKSVTTTQLLPEKWFRTLVPVRVSLN